MRAFSPLAPSRDGGAAVDPGQRKPVLGLRKLWAHKWQAIGLGLAVAAVLWFALRWWIGPEVIVYPVLRGDLVRTVVASGHVETPYRVEVGSQITATVKDVLVDEGQAVHQGQVLIALDPSELQSAVAQAQGGVAEAEAKMRQLRELTLPSAQEALKQAKANLADAGSAFDRASQLAKSGFGTKATLDDASKNLDIARTQVRTAELQVYTSSPGGSDFVVGETQLAQAQATLAAAQARLGYATITAPREGILIARSVERGTVAQAGKALLVLAPTGDAQLVLQIDEKNLGLLKLGQEALASADAFPDQRFHARLSYINPSVDIARASVEVKLQVLDPPDYLRQDMTISVDIAVDRRPGALIVPSRAIHDPTSASPWVLVMRQGRPRVQSVRIGLRAGDQVQVLDGLQEGELLVPVASGVVAGQRMRPVKA